MEAVDCEYICLSLRLVRFVAAASATGEGDDAVVAAAVCGVGCVCCCDVGDDGEGCDDDGCSSASFPLLALLLLIRFIRVWSCVALSF